MKKEEYLYNIKVEYPNGTFQSIFSSPHSFDIDFNHEKYCEDNRLRYSFKQMIFSDINTFITGPEDYWINNFKILSKAEYKLSYNKLLPDNLFKALSWFNKAITLYNEYNIDMGEEPELIIKHTNEAFTDIIFRNWDFNNLTETSYLGCVNRNIDDKLKKIQHAEMVLKYILKEINIDKVAEYDCIIQEYKSSHWKEIENIKWKFGEPQENKVIRGNIGHYPIIIPIKGAIELEDYKINLLTHIGKLVSEIRFILAELLDSIMDYKPFEGMNYNSLFYENLSDVFIMFKIRLIKEKKKHIIENKDYSVSLNDLFNEKEYDTILNDKDTVLSTLVSSFKKREKVQAMLDDIDEHYYISKSVKFEKRKLAIIVYILQYCDLFNRMSYETFKKNICWYYGKENVSMKPNKIQEEAIQEYYKKEFLYKKYNISIK